ncbi:elongation of very long chain fatty acids protein 7 [Drosophila pseudoobscura]|uniref:Elongation of very long chain fatty acids protein n=1 Tax=Drosophila pseudoobscura pseudoobscura TaxID=46245 RepID=A0A6I8UUU1_DROPS|nr:elongation of very long chain fatty acids protein 7 [Drosophila pseudoobscura]
MEAATSASAKVMVDLKHPWMMADPWFMVATLGIYLYFVTSVGPLFMQFRKPYELKKLIIAHNVIQVVSCIYIIREIFYLSDNSIYIFWKCRDLGSSPEMVRRYYELAYFLFFLKTSELLETVIFVLRKKQNQVSNLHLFHHLSTLTLVYILIHYNQNGLAAYYVVFLNSVVHIFMYSYYLVAAVADKSTIRALTPVKKFITVIQMVQFCLILTQAAFQTAFCGVPKVVFGYFTFVITVMLYGFYDFFTRAYSSPKHGKSESSVE